MYYEINVAKKNEKGDYEHYFATAKRSITTKTRLKIIVTDFMEKFPEPEFSISVAYAPEMSVGMSAESFLENPDELTY